MFNNIFSGKRFWLLCKQHVIHNNQLLLFSTVAYIGVIFIVLSIAQIGNNFIPHDPENFRGFMIGFVAVFGILYGGYSFPALRTKERSINYLLLPSSVLEKFLFELLSRIGLMVILLPFFFWITFHLQGYFLSMFTDQVFNVVLFHHLSFIDLSTIDHLFWVCMTIGFGGLLALLIPFTGASMFSKQPLVKTLFSIAVIILFFAAFMYIVLELLGVGKYDSTESMWLVPNGDLGAFQFLSSAFILANGVILFVAFRKLKEKEV